MTLLLVEEDNVRADDDDDGAVAAFNMLVPTISSIAYIPIQVVKLSLIILS